MTQQKDPETWLRTVIKVCSRDPEMRFVWAGSGELAESLVVGIEKAGLSQRVSFPGFLEDPAPFWDRIDVFFLPSAFEALGTVLFDALARSVPIVATAVGGIPEVIPSAKHGILAQPRDDEALANALIRLQRDPDLARAMGEAGRHHVTKFEIGAVVDRIEELYGRLAGST